MEWERLEYWENIILTGVLVDRMKMTGSWVDVILVCFIFEGMFVGGMKMTSVLDG